MSDILSQDQIDALLNSQGFGGDENGGGIDVNDPNYIHSFLIKVFDVFCEQASTVISTVLNKKVSYHTEIAEAGSLDTLREKMPAVHLALKVSLKSKVQGDFYIIIQKKTVAVLADLMMMGEGNAEYTEDHKDAIGEMFNQVMGAFISTLRADWSLSLTSDSIVVEEFDAEHPSFDISSCGMILVSQNIDQIEETSIVILVPGPLSKQLIEHGKAFNDSKDSSAEMVDGISLNMSELDDLSKVTAYSDSSDTSVGAMVPDRGSSSASQHTIDLLLDVDLDVSIELGNSMLSIKKILDLAPGSIVELDRMAGEPVDLLVNNKVVAKGEVVVIDENFGIRIVSLVSMEERIRSLR